MAPIHEQSLTKPQPTVHKAGTYQVKLVSQPRVFATSTAIHFCHVYRNDLLITTASARTPSQALTEARRNVRNARKAGGL